MSKADQKELWTFEKSQAFLPSLLQFLLDLGFTLEDDFEIKFYFGVPHKDDECLSNYYIKDPFSQKYLAIEKIDQEIFTFNKEILDIDAIFFTNHIVLAIRSDKDASEIGKLISKFAFFEGNIK